MTCRRLITDRKQSVSRAPRKQSLKQCTFCLLSIRWFLCLIGIHCQYGSVTYEAFFLHTRYFLHKIPNVVVTSSVNVYICMCGLCDQVKENSFPVSMTSGFVHLMYILTRLYAWMLNGPGVSLAIICSQNESVCQCVFLITPSFSFSIPLCICFQF